MTAPLDRRLFLGFAGALAASGFARPLLAAVSDDDFRMWHSPGCGCCLEWAKRIEAGFKRKLTVITAPNMAAVKRANGVPAALQSCHTARIGGLVVEGHVPPADIARLIKDNGKGAHGLAVPGMPTGSPGMDVGHDHRDPFKVYAFGGKGAPWVYAAHG